MRWLGMKKQLVYTMMVCSLASAGTNVSYTPREAYRELERHAFQKGLRFPKVHIKEDVATGARGLFVKPQEEIAAGEPIIVLPGSFALISTSIFERLGQHSMKVAPEIEALTASQLLASRLLEELIASRSRWARYLRALPTLDSLISSLPFLWPPSLRASLAGSAAYLFAEHLRQDLDLSITRLCGAAEYFPPANWAKNSDRELELELRKTVFCDRALVTWAYSIVRTRSFDAPDNPRAGMLLPLADFVNHSPESPEFHLPSSNGKGYGGLIAAARLVGGEEVLASYAESSNANLVANYGFIQPSSKSNINDIILVSTALVHHLETCEMAANQTGETRAETGPMDACEAVRGYLEWSGQPSGRLKRSLDLICRQRQRECEAERGDGLCVGRLLLRLVDLLRARWAPCLLPKP